MTEKEQNKLRRYLNKLLNICTLNDELVFSVDGKEQGKYTVKYACEPDCKSPMDWLNSNFFFYEINGGKGEIKITIRECKE